MGRQCLVRRRARHSFVCHGLVFSLRFITMKLGGRMLGQNGGDDLVSRIFKRTNERLSSSHFRCEWIFFLLNSTQQWERRRAKRPRIARCLPPPPPPLELDRARRKILHSSQRGNCAMQQQPPSAFKIWEIPATCRPLYNVSSAFPSSYMIFTIRTKQWVILRGRNCH